MTVPLGARLLGSTDGELSSTLIRYATPACAQGHNRLASITLESPITLVSAHSTTQEAGAREMT